MGRPVLVTAQVCLKFTLGEGKRLRANTVTDSGCDEKYLRIVVFQGLTNGKIHDDF